MDVKPAKHRQGGAHQGGGRDQHEGASRQSRRLVAPEMIDQAVIERPVDRTGGGHDPRYGQGQDPDAQFEFAVKGQQRGPGGLPVDDPAHPPAAQGQPGHENRQYGGHGKGGAADDLVHKTHPDDLIDQPGRPRKEETERHEPGQQGAVRRRGMVFAIGHRQTFSHEYVPVVGNGILLILIYPPIAGG